MTIVNKIWPFAGILKSPPGDSNPEPLHYK